MKKVWRVLSIVVAIVLALGMTAFAEDDVATISAGVVEAKAGQKVKLDVVVENNPGIVVAGVTVTFDDKLFSLTGVLDGGIWGDNVHSPSYGKSPYVLFWDNSVAESEFEANGVLATLEFEVAENIKPGSYPIIITCSYENGDAIDFNLNPVKFETVNGAIVVEGESQTSENEFTEERESAMEARKGNVIALKINAGTAYAYGKTEAIDPDNSKVVPYLKNDRTLVPLRFVSETLGAEVQWENGWDYCYVVKGDKKIKITFNSADIEVNGQVVTYDAPVEVVQDRTMVPIRFISEELGYDVKWNQANQLVIITPADNAWNEEGQAEKDVLEGILVTFLFNGIF